MTTLYRVRVLVIRNREYPVELLRFDVTNGRHSDAYDPYHEQSAAPRRTNNLIHVSSH